MTELRTPPTPDSPPSADEARAEKQDEGNPIRVFILGALVALLGVAGGWPMLVVVLGVVVMIFLHELGHYLAAKWSGMKVTEFFIGFGPRIWSFRRGETEYGVKAIPAGAYVKIVGMNNLDENDPVDEDRTYRSKSYPKRMMVAVAGSTMHFFQAIVLLFVLFAFVGIPGGSLDPEKLPAWEIAAVSEDSAAEAAGLESGDEIDALDGAPVEEWSEFSEEIGSRAPGDEVSLTVERDGSSFDVPVTLGAREDNPDQAFLGIGPGGIPATVGPVDAVGSAVTGFVDQSRLTLEFLGSFFTPSGIADFAGKVADGEDDSVITQQPSGDGSSSSDEVTETPDEGRIISIVGAVQLGSNLTADGMLGFLVFFVAINITIGIVNLLPVLPLDGGHVVVGTYERIRELGRPRGERYHVDYTKLIPVVYTVIVLLGMLFVSTVFLDIVDPVT
ncbi:MAG: M50 family metallopeptidase [Acidimicrobiales bacterium]|nr:M50 family metallopeptidase [Acidimicrobiales bacterium]